MAAAVLLSATVGGASFEGISVAQAQVGQTGAGGVHRVFEGLYFWDGNGWEPVYKDPGITGNGYVSPISKFAAWMLLS
jgi:hypothetical protein